MDKTSIFLSDWQVLFREGIHFTLSGEEDLFVTGETTSNKDALEYILKNPPRIAIININHSEFTGMNLTRNIRRDLPRVSVILVMETDNEDQVYSALKCGAAACVAKDIDPEELVSLVRLVAGGADPASRSVLRPGIAVRILDDFESFSSLSSEMDNLLSNLTAREVDILHRIAAGGTPEEIAVAMGISGDEIGESTGIIRQKLVVNEHSRELVEAAQKGMTSIINRARRGKTGDYITREEFESFRNSLKEHFKAITDG